MEVDFDDWVVYLDYGGNIGEDDKAGGDDDDRVTLLEFNILGQSRPTAGKAQTVSLGQDTVLWCSQPTKPWEPTKNHDKP